MSVSANGPLRAGVSGPIDSAIKSRRPRRANRATTQPSGVGPTSRGVMPKVTPYLFVAVAVGLLVLLTYLPAANMLWYSLNDWTGFGPVDEFVGLDNYVEVFTNPSIFSVFGVSLYYFAASFLQMAIALYFATILSFHTRFANFFKGVIFFPYLMNGVAIGFVFLYLFQPGGTLDTVLGWLGEETRRKALVTKPQGLFGFPPI